MRILLSTIAFLVAIGPAAPRGILAFGTGQYVFAVGARGGNGHALGLGDYPAYSRGGRLAFTLNGVWTAQANGSNRRQIVPRFAEYLTYTSPTWSPDGKRIAYVRVDNGHETSELWLVDADGRHVHGLSIVHVATSAAWSPGGSWIAYCGDGGLSEVRPDGTARRLLLAGAITSPAWSPDGTRIAFELQTGRTAAIEVLRVATRRLTVLARHTGPPSPLAWSPGGEWLAFATAHGGAGEALVDLAARRVAGGPVHTIARTYVQRLDGLAWRN